MTESRVLGSLKFWSYHLFDRPTSCGKTFSSIPSFISYQPSNLAKSNSLEKALFDPSNVMCSSPDQLMWSVRAKENYVARGDKGIAMQITWNEFSTEKTVSVPQRMGKNNRLPRHKTSEMTSTTAWRTGFPSTRSAPKLVLFLVAGQKQRQAPLFSR